MGFNPDIGPIGSESSIHLRELNAKDLETARRLAADPGFVPNNSRRTQAKEMANFAHIDLRPEEVRLYCALRAQGFPAMHGGIMAQGETGNGAEGLSDQEILAAVLREYRNEEILKKLVDSHPNNFH